jgi:hypothetical protein
MNGIIAALDSSDVICKYIRTKINPANSFTSPEPAAAFRRNTAFVCGTRDPALPAFTTLRGEALADYLLAPQDSDA